MSASLLPQPLLDSSCFVSGCSVCGWGGWAGIVSLRVHLFHLLWVVCNRSEYGIDWEIERGLEFCLFKRKKKKTCRCSKYARTFYHSLKSQKRLSDFTFTFTFQIWVIWGFFFFQYSLKFFFWLCHVTCGISVPEPGILNLCPWQWICRLLGNSLSVLFWWLKLFSELNCYNNNQPKMKDFSSYNFSSIGLWHFYLWFLN